MVCWPYYCFTCYPGTSRTSKTYNATHMARGRKHQICARGLGGNVWRSLRKCQEQGWRERKNGSLEVRGHTQLESQLEGKWPVGLRLWHLTWALGLQLCNLKDPGVSPHTQTRICSARHHRLCPWGPWENHPSALSLHFLICRMRDFDQICCSQSRLGMRTSRGILRKCQFLGPSPNQWNQNPDIRISQKFPRWFHRKPNLRTTGLISNVLPSLQCLWVLEWNILRNSVFWWT